ncbi:MAG: hypothetical protein AAGI52_00435 [Bacteroidota bacterium]
MPTVAALLLLAALQAPSEDLRQRAASLAAEADTLGAVATLDVATSGKWTSPDALLTLGQFHLSRGEAGPAVLALERASRLAPSDPEIASARREAYGLAGQVAPTVAPPFVASRTVVRWIGAGALVALTLLLYFSTLALAVLWWKHRDRRLGSGAVALGLLALAALALSSLALWDAGAPQGVAMAETEIRVRPTPEAGVVGRLREGEMLMTEDADGGWRQVQVGEIEGWVPARSVERL